MQYLSGHASTVGRMLGSIPEQNSAGTQDNNNIAMSQQLYATAPAVFGGGGGSAGGSIRASSTAASHRSSAQLQQADAGAYAPQQAHASPAAAAAAGARRSSVSAFLQGQQDLLTTITAGVPYASPEAAPGRSSTFSNASGGSSSSIMSAAANSRHMAVKEALAARMSAAGEHRHSRECVCVSVSVGCVTVRRQGMHTCVLTSTRRRIRRTCTNIILN